MTELTVIENLLKIIVSIFLWFAIAHTLLLGVIYFTLRKLLIAFTRKHGQDD